MNSENKNIGKIAIAVAAFAVILAIFTATNDIQDALATPKTAISTTRSNTTTTMPQPTKPTNNKGLFGATYCFIPIVQYSDFSVVYDPITNLVFYYNESFHYGYCELEPVTDKYGNQLTYEEYIELMR